MTDTDGEQSLMDRVTSATRPDEITESTTSMAITPEYKVLGEFEAADGTAVLGQNNAGSGTPIGVQGAVPNEPSGFGLATPDDARIDGKIDTLSSFSVDINGRPTITHLPDRVSGRGGSVLMGNSTNAAADSFTIAEGATVSGGGYDDGTTSEPNEVYDHFGTVSGGRNNQAGKADGDVTTQQYATVGGGRDNKAKAQEGTVSGGFGNEVTAQRGVISGGDSNLVSGGRGHVGGGFNNDATGFDAVVPGGQSCFANGNKSFAAGGRAEADDDQAFVWNDSTGYHTLNSRSNIDGLSSAKDVASSPSGVTGPNTFHVGATGGIRFVTGSSSVTYISGGTAGWSTTSTRTAKTNVEPVDPESVLDGVETMEVSTWEYEDEDGDGTGERYIGPMAEDFHDVVDVGDSDEHINSINADGVAMAAIQGLSRKVDEKDDRIENLEAENRELRDDVQSLEAENEALRERLAAVEDHLEIEAGDRPAPADD